jgi:type 1 glutamine amidotransferase
MKFFKFFILSSILICCNVKNDSVENTAEQSDPEPIKQWLMMEGEENKPHVVLISGDEEYRSEEALPQLAKILSERHGFKCTVLFSQDPEKPGIVDPNFVNNIPGLEYLKTADLMIIFTRFRALPDEQMKHIDDYLKSGKPVIGIRTATHGFQYGKNDSTSNYLHYGNSYKSEDDWNGGFGRLVMGEKWISHHGGHGRQSTKGVVASGLEDHPILNGIEEGGIWGPTDVYGVRLPLPGDSQPIVYGQVTDREGELDENDPRLGMRPTDSEPSKPVMRKNREGEEVEVDMNNPMMPVAWTKTYKLPEGQSGKTFATTLGSSTDMLAEGTRRMMVNAAFWCLELEVPQKANVDLIGIYEPTRFAFRDDTYWAEKEMKISSLE